MNTRRLRTVALTLIAQSLLLTTTLSPATARAQEYVMREVMSGLVSPRGLSFGPDGGLYVAEAGSGGNGTSIVLGSGNTA
jgi:hypothetical protein